MPVHRLPGKKSRVWAELDAWKTEASLSGHEPPRNDLNQLSETKPIPSETVAAQLPGDVSGKSADAVAILAVTESPTSPDARKCHPKAARYRYNWNVPSLRTPVKTAPPELAVEAVIKRATEVMGDRNEAMRWLGTPVRALDYATPVSLLGTRAGATRVEDVLGQMEHGVW